MIHNKFFINFQPELYTQEYIDSKNILKLNFSSFITKDIFNNILSYINKYATGYSLYDHVRIIHYKINNEIKIYDNKNGHPFEYIIRILCEINISNNNLEFNNLLNIIKNTPNYLKAKMNPFIKYCVHNKYLYSCITKPANFEMLFDLIDQKFMNNELSNNTCHYTMKSKCNNCNHQFMIQNIPIVIDLIDESKKLDDYIYNKSHYYKPQFNCSNCNQYENFQKYKININKFLFITVDRTIFDENWVITVNQNKIIINEIFKLPFFACSTKKSETYILKYIILIKNKKYSLILNKDNEYYYFYKGMIKKISFDFIQNNDKYITNICYKLI